MDGKGAVGIEAGPGKVERADGHPASRPLAPQGRQPAHLHPVQRVRVLLDAGPAVHQGAGLSRYAERLAANLQSGQSRRVDLTLFYNAHSGCGLPSSLEQLPASTLSLGQYAWRLSVLASQLVRWPYYEGRLPQGDVFHATEHLLPRLARPTVLTVHDLIFERYPQHHTRANRAFLKLGMPLFVRAAHAIIAVSRHTRNDLVDLYGVPVEKIEVIYQGIDDHFAPIGPPAIQRARDRYSPDRPYLLMVGTLEPRKNHAAALRTLARLKAEGFPHRLLVAGGRGWLFEPVQRLVSNLGLAGDVVFAGRVADADLPALYAGAGCLLSPSLYEGFGFPVLEAMACGTPVVCSRAASLPEVAGDAALLVDAEDDQGLAAAVGRILTEPGLADGLRRAGQAQAARFRWDTCAAQTAEVYSRVVGRP